MTCRECGGAGRFAHCENPECTVPNESCDACDGEGRACDNCDGPLSANTVGDVCASCIADQKHGVAAEVRS